MPACQVHSESLTTGSNQEFTSDASGTLLYISLLGISARTRTHTHAHTHTLTHTERHTGPILWLQQFWAMFLKRFYNSLRFYVAVITQLILPLVFLVLALLIVKIPILNPQDDPRRVLTLRHSSLSEKAEAFLVQFSPIFGFQVIFFLNSAHAISCNSSPRMSLRLTLVLLHWTTSQETYSPSLMIITILNSRTAAPTDYNYWKSSVLPKTG